MAAQYIHVKIGLTDGIFPVRKFITTGVMHDMYEFQQDERTIGWVHKRWCTPCTANGKPIAGTESQDTDWRKFLQDHWDTERNHCKVEYLDEFYRIFRRAAAAYTQKPKYEQETKVRETGKQMKPVPYAATEQQPQPKKKPRYVELSLFD